LYGIERLLTYLRRASLSFGMVGNGMKILICSILVCFLLYFLSICPRIIIEGFWHAKDIEERAIAIQAK
jgi:hypothetical protein